MHCFAFSLRVLVTTHAVQFMHRAAPTPDMSCTPRTLQVSWNARSANAPTYIAVNSPEIDRFRDKLSWRGVLYGPGMPRLPASHLPESISKGAPPPLKTGRLLQSPDTFDSCDFVDENLVMRQYSSVTDGRCMENMKFKTDYKTPLVAGRKSKQTNPLATKILLEVTDGLRRPP